MDVAPPSTVEVGLGPRQARVLWAVTIGVLATGGALAAFGAFGTPRRPVPLVVGLAIVAFGVFLVRSVPKIMRPRQLILDGRGIRLVDTGWRSFEVEWGELLQVRASYARKPGPVRSPLSWGGTTADAGPDGTLERSFGVSTFVRVDLVPADPAFLDRHPAMQPYRRFTGRPAGTPTGVGEGGAPWAEDVGGRQVVLRVPFGDQPELLAAVDHALRLHAGTRYHPPVNEGLALGFRYS